MARLKFEENREEKIEKKKRYFAELAKKLANESNSKCEEAIKLSKVIPFGQPIHIGHHSEKSDRAFRNKIDNKMKSSVLLQKKSEYYSRKSETNSSTIHSLDKCADEKIIDKINNLKLGIDLMKQANSIIKNIHNQEQLDEFLNNPNFDITIKDIIKDQRESTKRYFNPSVFIFKLSLTNSQAEVRRLEKRLKIIKIQDERIPFYFKNNNGEIKEEESRFNIYFYEVPCTETRTKLKKQAFKWSPTRKAWTRQITTSTNSKRVFDSIIEILEAI